MEWMNEQGNEWKSWRGLVEATTATGGVDTRGKCVNCASRRQRTGWKNWCKNRPRLRHRPRILPPACFLPPLTDVRAVGGFVSIFPASQSLAVAAGFSFTFSGADAVFFGRLFRGLDLGQCNSFTELLPFGSHFRLGRWWLCVKLMGVGWKSF